ncbi:MAG: hypothetical protein WC341_10445, partial [Bacteroidales bacterium]
MRHTLKKLHISYFLVPILLIAGFFLMRMTMPVYSGQYVFLVVLILADLYLWSSVKRQVFNYRNWLRISIIFLYWLPLILLATLLVGAKIVPLIDWSNTFRTYLLGFILVLYTAKVLPIIFLLLADFVRIIDRMFTLSKKQG